MTRFSSNVARLEPSATLAITARARKMQAAGEAVVNLSAGEPSFATPAPAREAADASVRAGKTGYPPTPGLPELRRSIAGYTMETSDASDLDPNQVIVAAGVKQVLFNLTYCLFQAGDEVILPSPFWPSYTAIIELSGATPVTVPLEWEDDFRISVDRLEAARTPRTRGLFLNSPSNPTGATVGMDDLRAILEWADRHGIWILSDEIYRRLHYPAGEAPSVLDEIGSLERVVAMDGVSKAFSMPGWRIGWGVGPAAVIEKAAALQSQTTSGAAGPSQHAALGILTDPGRESVVADFRSQLDRRRKTSLEILRRAPSIEIREQPGAIYHYLKLVDHPDSMQAAERLLVQGGVAAIPGEAFGAAGYLRITYAPDDATVREGCERIAAFFE